MNKLELQKLNMNKSQTNHSTKKQVAQVYTEYMCI